MKCEGRGQGWLGFDIWGGRGEVGFTGKRSGVITSSQLSVPLSSYKSLTPPIIDQHPEPQQVFQQRDPRTVVPDAA
jgi:hypothetical protein